MSDWFEGVVERQNLQLILFHWIQNNPHNCQFMQFTWRKRVEWLTMNQLLKCERRTRGEIIIRFPDIIGIYSFSFSSAFLHTCYGDNKTKTQTKSFVLQISKYNHIWHGSMDISSFSSHLVSNNSESEHHKSNFSFLIDCH